AAYPQAKWHRYESISDDNRTAAFGQPVSVHHDLENAEVILSLDSDFLTSSENPSFLKDARAFATRRKAEIDGKKNDKMKRLYVVESGATTTGGKADHRLAMQASAVENVARAIASKLGAGSGGDAMGKDAWVDALAKDLQAHRGSSIVLAG